MTSKHLFFKVMREDLRHKIWMIALSSLVSFFALPVVWLIMESNAVPLPAEAWKGNEYIYYQELGKLVADLNERFYIYLILAGGAIAIVGAIVTGLAGFRYLFHKNMVDIYHSMPVKRNTLFGACYVDGILIWFVPFFVFLVLAAVMVLRFLSKLEIRGQDIAVLFKTVFIVLVLLITVFLLVYNLVLTAVMLSGNILNTLVGMVILGVGAVLAWWLGIAFCELYLETFYAEIVESDKIVYFSPLVSAVYLLYAFADVTDVPVVMGKLFLNLLIAVFLGLCVWQLYQKRDSELAEQGVSNKVMALLMKVMTAVAAGMGGWQIFIMLAGDKAVVWGCFGLIFTAVITFGVLDIIFNMDFKAFFAHKLQMAVTVAVSMFLCFAFYRDWFSYDTYLPKQEEIAEISIYDYWNANCYGSWQLENDVLEGMHYQDAEAIHAWLERMVEGVRDVRESANISGASLYGYMAGHKVAAKITLKSGRSYYREYMVWDKDKDALGPLLTSEEYLKNAYCVSDEDVADGIDFMLSRNKSVRLENYKQETLASIIHAYNEDVLENPEKALFGQGRMLVRLIFHTEKNKELGTFTLDIYESMERTVEAMRQAGFREWVDIAELSEVSSIGLTLESNYLQEKESTAEKYIAGAREKYGVYLQNTAEGNGTVDRADLEVSNQYLEDEKNITLEITDREEIEELLQYISYALPRSTSFRGDYVSLQYTRQDGSIETCYIRQGLLPEKYILRFGEL